MIYINSIPIEMSPSYYEDVYHAPWRLGTLYYDRVDSILLYKRYHWYDLTDFNTGTEHFFIVGQVDISERVISSRRTPKYSERLDALFNLTDKRNPQPCVIRAH